MKALTMPHSRTYVVGGLYFKERYIINEKEEETRLEGQKSLTGRLPSGYPVNYRVIIG